MENGTYLLERQFMKGNIMSRIAMVNLAYGTLKSDDSSSYNYIFGQVKRSIFIDLRKANGVTKTWLNEQHQFSLE